MGTCKKLTEIEYQIWLFNIGISNRKKTSDDKLNKYL